MARYFLGVTVATAWPTALPLGTLVVNVVGCAAIGALSILVERVPPAISRDLWALLATGFLGGFTTYSAFALESTTLVERGSGSLAGLHVALHLVMGLAAVFGGRAMVRLAIALVTT